MSNAAATKAEAAGESSLGLYLDELVDELRRLVPAAVGKFEEGATHRARVATRRLKAALDLLEPVLSERRRDAFGKVTRKLRRRLGPLRDLDVMIGHLERLRSKKHAEATAWLRDRLVARRSEARVETNGRVDASRVLGRLSAWWELREEIEAADEALLPLLSESLHLQLDRFAEGAAALPRGSGDAAAGETTKAPSGDPHELRIAGKRLRYTLELAAEAGHPLDPMLFKAFKKMQDALGAWHDYVVLSEQVLRVSAAEQVGLHLPQMQMKLLELARLMLHRAGGALERFAQLWDERGAAIAQAIREAFPLTRDATAAVAATPGAPGEAATESQTDRGPSGSDEPAGPEDQPPGAAPAA